MPHLRFDHVFLGLMLLAFCGAFVAPERFSRSSSLQFDGAFVLVSGPAYRLGNMFRRRVSREEVADPRPSKAVQEDNLVLQEELAALQQRVRDLQVELNERSALGDAQGLMCHRFAVSGTSSSGDLLILSGGASEGIAENQAVFYAIRQTQQHGLLAGRIEQTSARTSSVRLISDVNFFVRLRLVGPGQRTDRTTSPPYAQGLGRGQIAIENLEMRDVEPRGPVHLGDYAVLDDDKWPVAAQGTILGQITSISPSSNDPLFAEIRLSPPANLLDLTDVWVMNHPGNG